MRCILLVIAVLISFYSNLFCQWEEANNGMYGGRITALAVSDTNIYAGTQGAGIFLSSDNCKNWRPINNGLFNLNVNCLTISGNYIYAGTAQGLYFSSDNGANWEKMISGISIANSSITGIVLKDSLIFASTSKSIGIFIVKKIDNQWDVTNSKINHGVTSMTIKDNIIFAGTGSTGIYLSTDNGNSWQQVESLKYKSITEIVSGNDKIYAGCFDGDSSAVYMSKDNGVQWQKISNSLSVSAIRALLVKDSCIYVGAEMSISYSGGIYFTSDDGNHWEKRINGLNDNNIYSLSVKDNNLIAGTYNKGIFVSSDLGKKWINSSHQLTNVNVVSFTSINSDLYAATLGLGIFKSSDNGNSWQSVSELSDSYINCIASIDKNLYACNNTGLYLSTDEGENWKHISDSLYSQTINIILPIDKSIYVGFYDVSSTSDNGNSWNYILNSHNSSDHDFTALAYHGRNLYAGTRNGKLYYSDDLGQNCKKIDTAITYFKINSIATCDSSIFVSSVGCIIQTKNNWKNFKTDCFNRKSINSIYVNEQRIFAASSEGGFFEFNKNNESWDTLNTGLTYADINSIYFNGKYMFVGTMNGIYRSKEIITNVENDNYKDYTILVYPNPASNSVTIGFNTEESVNIKMVISDMLGNEVINWKGISEKGGNIKKFDIESISSGIYILSVNIDGKIYTNKIMKIN